MGPSVHPPRWSNFWKLINLLPPATKFGQGYVFTGVCDSVHGGEYLTRYLPRPGTPPGPITHWDQVHPPGSSTPPQTRYTLPQVHPRDQGDTVYAWAVHILLECILVYLFFPDIMREMIWKDQLLYLWIVWCLRILTWWFGIIAGIIGFYLWQYPGSYHQDNQH